MKLSSIAIVILILAFNFCTPQQPENTKDAAQPISRELSFDVFLNPPAEAKPFVRWWWNGNRISADEIKRELDIMAEAGIGGVEINPIAFPDEATDTVTQSLKWLSSQWNELLVLAAQEASKRGMIADMIVGSGWPFGGEFLKPDEYIQRVINNKIEFKGPMTINENKSSLLQKISDTYDQQQNRSHIDDAYSNELLYLTLVPDEMLEVDQVINLMNQMENDAITYQIPAGDFTLSYGILQRGHRDVMLGSPGAAGPVMNHYDKEVSLQYLNRLKEISEDTGVPLSDIIRALFCDSIELAGANWTDGFEGVFFETYGYRLEPYFPFIFYPPYEGYQDEFENEVFQEQINRVRYDYNSLLVKVFLDNFTRTFQEFCTENGLQCRYQAYGTPFLMGMMEGNMIPDIPESNNWIYSADMDAPQWTWSQGHGYMIWNMYAAAGGHLQDRKIISCESMTNTRGVFKTSLEEIKQHDDMNFITGINHSVLHGFNYSPPEAGFPGWIRFGAYFSEQNTWWPYFKKWATYNARLSYVFQNSKPVKSIAILGPTSDLWTNIGLTRTPFHLNPWYCYKLWEPISQVGGSAEYINEQIIQNATIKNAKLKYGPMEYQTVILSSIHSIAPETARSLQEFVASGGKLVMIDSIPSRSLSLNEAKNNDQIVVDAFEMMQNEFPDQILKIESPDSEGELLEWTQELFQRMELPKEIEVNNPVDFVYQIHQKSEKKDIYFLTNTHRINTINMEVTFPVSEGLTPWIWNPEKGTRKVHPFENSKNQLSIQLRPLESILLVFEEESGNTGIERKTINTAEFMELEDGWELRMDHIDGTSIEDTLPELVDIGMSADPKWQSFAGTITYRTSFIYQEGKNMLDLGEVNKGITEVWINGQQVGINWYGKPLFDLSEHLQEGSNQLQIKYTSVLSNYCKSLDDNPTAERWTSGYEQISNGLEGPVLIYESN